MLKFSLDYSWLMRRPGVEETIQKLSNHQWFSIGKPKYNDPHANESVFFQANTYHLVLSSRIPPFFKLAPSSNGGCYL